MMKKVEVIYICIFLFLAVSTTLVFAVNFDFNNDGVVNITDLQNLGSHYHGKAAYNSTFDLNNDSVVNVFDVVAIARNVGTTINSYFSSFISDTPQIITTPLYFAYPGIEYNIRPGVIAGRYPYTFSLTTKPSGMTMNSTTGEISWVPSTGLEGQNSSVNYTVTDSAGRTTYQNFTINSTIRQFYFMATNGSDGSGNGSIGNPWLTMNYSIRQGNTGNILYVRNGTYIGGITIASGTINKWIAYPGGHPVIDMNFTTYTSPRDNYGLVDGFEVTNMVRWFMSFDGNFSGWIFRRNTMHEIYSNAVSENPAFAFFWDQAPQAYPNYLNFTFQNNTFYNLFDRNSGLHGDTSANYHGSSTTWYDVGNSLFEGNNVSNIDGAGFDDKDDGFANTIRGNIVFGTYSCGIDLLVQGITYKDEVSYNKLFNTSDQCGLTIGSQLGNITNVSIHHNTVVGTIRLGAVPVGDNNSIRFYNNLVYYFASVEPQDYLYRYAATAPSDYIDPIYYRDYNVLYTNQSYIAGVAWNEHFNITDWQALGFDNHSNFSDPLFTNLSIFNLQPLSNSPACGRGRNGDDIGAIAC